jgi:hypothetical protein
MANQSLHGYDAGAELLRARELARRVRRSQQATWLPLTVFGVLLLASLPITFAGHAVRTRCAATPGGRPGREICSGYNSAAFIYWPIGLVAAYVVIALFYVRRSRSRGVGTRVWPYVVAGLIISIGLTAASVWADHRPVSLHRHDLLGWHLQTVELYRVVAPACAIGLTLLVLVAVERSLALLAVTTGYLVIVVGRIDFGWTIDAHSRWTLAPHDVIPGSLLLLAAVGFALAQHGRAAA